ncbi:MAG: hypothetical protein HY556_03540 [Euryarchaeota archaeon]|nr:hypothetical protein [Euryarchaeota archaeon]
MTEQLTRPLPHELTWEGLADHASTMTGLTKYQREAARRAFDDFDKLFGNDIWKIRHPLRDFVTNLAPWTRIVLAQLAEDLRVIQDAPRFHTVTKRLRTPEKWQEGWDVSQIAARLVAKGFKIEFDPPVVINGGPRVPDLVITNQETNDQIHVELAALGASIAEKRAYAAFDELIRLVGGKPGIEFAGRMLRTPSKPLLQELVRRTQKAVATATKTGRTEIVNVPDVLQLGVAPRSDSQFLQDWKEDNKLQGFSGPPTTPDTTRRVKTKIRNEQGQLPTNTPGAIVISVPFNFFPWDDEMGERATNLRELGEAVAEYPHVLSVILRNEILDFSPENKFLHVEGQNYARRATRPPYSEEIMVLTNQYCKLPLAPATMTAWSRTFLG